ncbi:DUF421 domain-containing protein [Brevibacillus laterosporus]|uniref:DUF421 domain-containing protein n=1 Tax=Brevibacillus TaxID=55080 RepID=UPI00215C7BE5|nr:DUF421 domain-containing protein [Brevibacillus laterosporus]MCR8962137.1 DUF421 domain-containing protein [Brevibacillus laterosporus]
MELLTILMRTLFSYFFLLLIMRLMGKRELGQMSLFDVVISIMLAEMAVLAIDQVEKPLLHMFSPMILIMLLEIGMAYLFMKSKKIRNFVNGEADVLIANGEIREEALKKNRLNLDDLLIHLRQENVKNLADVEFAILETTGKVSVFTKPEKSPVTLQDLGLQEKKPKKSLTGVTVNFPIPLIMDGEVQTDAVEKIGKNIFWLKQELKKQGYRHTNEIMFCSIDEQGKLFVNKTQYPRK